MTTPLFKERNGAHGKYSPELCPLLIDLMGRGMTPAQVASRLHVSKQRLMEWAANPEYKDFKEALEIGMTKCEAYWTDKGQSGMVGELDKFKESTYKLYMSQHFSWAEKTEQKVESTTRSLSDAELEERIKTYITTVGKDLPKEALTDGNTGTEGSSTESSRGEEGTSEI